MDSKEQPVRHFSGSPQNHDNHEKYESETNKTHNYFKVAKTNLSKTCWKHSTHKWTLKCFENTLKRYEPHRQHSYFRYLLKCDTLISGWPLAGDRVSLRRTKCRTCNDTYLLTVKQREVKQEGFDPWLSICPRRQMTTHLWINPFQLQMFCYCLRRFM